MAYAADAEQTIEVELSGLTSPAGKKYNGRRATVSSAKMKNKQNDRWTVKVGDEYVQVRKENLTVVENPAKKRMISMELPLH